MFGVACWLLLLLLLFVAVCPRTLLVSAVECANVTAAAPGQVWTRVPYNFQGGAQDLSILTCSPGFTFSCRGVPAIPATNGSSGGCTDGYLCYHQGNANGQLLWRTNMLIEIGSCIPIPTTTAPTTAPTTLPPTTSLPTTPMAVPVDVGFLNSPHGYYDIQGLGAVDYCRYVGDGYPSCKLSGTNKEYTPRGVIEVQVLPHLLTPVTPQPTSPVPVPSDKGYQGVQPRGYYDVFGIGQAVDYCRMVGDFPGWPSCALAGTNQSYTAQGAIQLNFKLKKAIPVDFGRADMPHGYYDIQGLGVAADYCRYVSVNGTVWPSCKLAGSNQPEYTPKGQINVVQVNDAWFFLLQPSTTPTIGLSLLYVSGQVWEVNGAPAWQIPQGGLWESVSKSITAWVFLANNQVAQYFFSENSASSPNGCDPHELSVGFTPSGGFGVISGCDSGFTYRGLSMCQSNGHPCYDQAGQWYHIGLTFAAIDGWVGWKNLYVNGHAVTEGGLALQQGTYVGSPDHVAIGARVPINTQTISQLVSPWLGAIAQINVYSYALTQAEVQADMNGAVVNPGPMSAFRPQTTPALWPGAAAAAAAAATVHEAQIDDGVNVPSSSSSAASANLIAWVVSFGSLSGVLLLLLVAVSVYLYRVVRRQHADTVGKVAHNINTNTNMELDTQQPTIQV